MVLTGLERVLEDPGILDSAGRLGLLYNQASIDRRFEAAPDALAGVLPGRIKALFGPQHGTGATEQDNMLETAHGSHPRLNVPEYSLYSETRHPTGEMLESVDTVLVDIQDVGTRVYTFATTVLYLMPACAQTDKAVVILDRPNPVNGRDMEGNVLNPANASFVGPHPIPMRHGMTLGELMTLYNEERSIGCRLKVVRMKGWDRDHYFDQTGLSWIPPSPNMPLVETAVVYPGQVILEGTNLSEGRGTTRPFEIFGAPYLEPDRILAALEKGVLDGAVLREVSFRPTFNKWAGRVCRGFQIHVTDRNVFRPYRLSVAVIQAIRKAHPDRFSWSDPPYEYEYEKSPVDVILGDRRTRKELEQGCSVFEMEKDWEVGLSEFEKTRSEYLLYPG